jgi:hypothetical protein
VGQSSSQTAGTTTQTSQALTSKVTTDAKEEHKIEFQIQTQTGVSDVAQRVFINPNTEHTLMLNFMPRAPPVTSAT